MAVLGRGGNVRRDPPFGIVPSGPRGPDDDERERLAEFGRDGCCDPAPLNAIGNGGLGRVHDSGTELATFRNWRSLQARSRTPAGTSISFATGDGTYWKPVGSDGNITETNSTMIRWSATLATTNGLVTPTLERVDLVYEYLGLPARVELRWPGWPSPIVVPSGGVVKFTAVALDAGLHVISKEPNRFDWNTNDSHGQVGIDGSYRAGEAGDHIVNVTFVGTTLSATVHVRVLAAGTWIDAMIGYAPYWLAGLTLRAVGYTRYRFGIRPAP